MVSTQTREFIAEQLFEAGKELVTASSWEHLATGYKVDWQLFTDKVIEICRLPNEIDLRKRLLSDDARAAAGAEIDFYLPEGFVFPAEHSEMDTGDLFVAALVAALTETPPGG